MDERVPSDPRVVRSRAAIVEAASAHFLEHGYLEANLEDIARQAGVVKRTIYNIHGDKEQLFREILAEAIDTAERFSRQVVAELGADGHHDVEGELRETGVRLARAVLGGRIVPLRRLLIAEARRFPELAHDYYERAPGRVMAAIAEALRRYDQRGDLRIPDPGLAAEQFAFLAIGASLDRALFDAGGGPPPAGPVEARAAAGVEVFLRAHAVGDRAD
jgi:TetR/AcrR family transcriptional regulator, mexJK operon transcriptional repressor